MITTLSKVRNLLLTSAVLITASVSTSQFAQGQSYDMDCKVILCIAGGFPAQCSDAWRYMINRITRFPNPLPPFGFCAMSDGSEYQAHNVRYRYLRSGPEAYDCPDDKKLFYRRNDTDGNIYGSETAFCYTHTTQVQSGWGRDSIVQTVYHNRSAAKRVNFQLGITIEPGTAHEFRSPIFRINYHTGYFSQRQM